MDDLHKLLQMTIESRDKDGNAVQVTPDFRMAVQSTDERGWIHVIVHAHGYDSDTLDLMIGPSNQMMTLDRYKKLREGEARTFNT